MSIEASLGVDIPEAVRMQDRVIGLGFFREFTNPDDAEILFQQDVIYGNPAVREEWLVEEKNIADLNRMVGESIVWLTDHGEPVYDSVNVQGEIRQVVSRIFASDTEDAYLATDILPDSQGMILLLNMKYVDRARRRTVRFCIDSDGLFSFRMNYFDEKEERELAYQAARHRVNRENNIPISDMTKEECAVVRHYIGECKAYLEKRQSADNLSTQA